MQQKTDAILLKVKPYGNGAFLCTFFTAEWGKVSGLVKGGKKQMSLLQVGNVLEVERFRRLESQLGTFVVELIFSPAAFCFTSRIKLQFLHYLSEVILKGLKEEEPHARFFNATRDLLLSMNVAGLWDRIAFYELQLLSELGFGLSLAQDLAVQADGGDFSPLKFVSPKSGRAVSARAGEPYKAKLLALPHLFGGESEDFLDVFKLTGYFLEHAFEGETLNARSELIHLGIKSGFKDL